MDTVMQAVPGVLSFLLIALLTWAYRYWAPRIRVILAIIERELTPNSGASMRDDLKGLKVWAAAHDQKHAETMLKLDEIKEGQG